MPASSAAEAGRLLAELALNSIHWCDRLLCANPVYWQRSRDKEGSNENIPGSIDAD